MPSERQHNDQPELPRQRSRVYATISCAISICILIWFLSIPFRMRGSSLADTHSVKSTVLDKSHDVGERIKQKRIAAEQYQREARILDEQFMQKVADQTSDWLHATKPGIEHAREYRQAYKSRLQREIQSLGRPKEGSAQWDYRQFLLQKLESDEDAPQ